MQHEPPPQPRKTAAEIDANRTLRERVTAINAWRDLRARIAATRQALWRLEIQSNEQEATRNGLDGGEVPLP